MVLIVSTLAVATSALKYAPGYIDFTSTVNGSFMNAPVITGYGVDRFEPMVVETAMWYENYTGKAMVTDEIIHGISPETTVKRALKAGEKRGLGRPKIIFIPSALGIAGFGNVARDYSDVSWIKIPVVEVSLGISRLARELSKRNYPTKLGLLVRDDDTGPVGEAWTFGHVIISSALLTPICISAFAINIYKFVLHIKFTRGVTTAKIFFIIDLFANFMRFWFVTVNPFWTGRFDYTFTTICVRTPIALAIICTLLLALKWRELLLKSKVTVKPFLNVFKWPFIVMSVAIFTFEFVASALRGHWYDIAMVTKVSTCFLLVASALCAILVFISGAQIMCHLGAAVGSKRRLWQLSQTTILIIASGFGLFLWASLQVYWLILLYGRGTIIPTPKMMLQIQLIGVVGCGSLLCTSLLQNLAMPIPTDFLARSSLVAGTSATNRTGGTGFSSRRGATGISTRTGAGSAELPTLDDDEDDDIPSSSHSSHHSPDKDVLKPLNNEETETSLSESSSSSSSDDEDDASV